MENVCLFIDIQRDQYQHEPGQFHFNKFAINYCMLIVEMQIFLQNLIISEKNKINI